MLTDEETELRNRLFEKLKPAFRRNDKRPLVKKRFCYKRQFTKKEAETVLNFIRHKDKSNKRRKEVRLYHCPICNTHHLSSKQ